MPPATLTQRTRGCPANAAWAMRERMPLWQISSSSRGGAGQVQALQCAGRARTDARQRQQACAGRVAAGELGRFAHVHQHRATLHARTRFMRRELPAATAEQGPQERDHGLPALPRVAGRPQ